MDLMTMDEVSQLCRVKVATLRDWRYHGRGGPRAFKVGNRVVYDRADVLAWLQQQRDAAA